jgi:hypothetical protein
LKITIYNRGHAKAENCDATFTLIKHNSTSKLQPSERDKNIVWDTGEYYRNIGAKKGKAVLYVVFSQDTFAMQQTDSVAGNRSDEDKIYAKVCTLNSLNHSDTATLAFAEDGIGKGETYFKLFVKAITGESVERTFKIDVTNNWHELSMEQII